MKLGPACLLLLSMVVAVPAIAAPANCPNTGLARQPVTFVTDKGRFTYKVELAATPAQQECGLMFRKTMPRDVGMAFPFAQPRSLTFWMENTPLPLDLIFVGEDARVVSIGKGVPFTRDLIDSQGPASRVIELNAGEAKRIGLKPGDKVVP
jgi:uncharacterized membrane protein (UPF0127 family)